MTGAPGPAGPTGAAGPAGPIGPAGAKGPGLPSAFATNTQGTRFQVTAGGTSIPLPNDQLLSPEITVNPENTMFTVTQAGNYQISYHVNTTAALLMGTRLIVNGTKVPASVIEPLVSISSFENRVQVSLTPNSTVSLQLFTKIAGTAILAGGGVGASLNIIRLGD